MKKDKKTQPKPESEPQATNIKVHKDFNDFGRITSENLNEYFDVDLMAAARRLRDRK